MGLIFRVGDEEWLIGISLGGARNFAPFGEDFFAIGDDGSDGGGLLGIEPDPDGGRAGGGGDGAGELVELLALLLDGGLFLGALEGDFWGGERGGEGEKEGEEEFHGKFFGEVNGCWRVRKLAFVGE